MSFPPVRNRPLLTQLKVHLNFLQRALSYSLLCTLSKISLFLRWQTTLICMLKSSFKRIETLKRIFDLHQIHHITKGYATFLIIFLPYYISSFLILFSKINLNLRSYGKYYLQHASNQAFSCTTNL